MTRCRLLLGAALLALAAVFAMAPAAPEPALAAPANDNFANAIAITTPTTSGIVAVGSNVGATTEGGENQPCGSIGATVWYNWTSPAGTGTVVFDTLGSDFDTVLAIYTGIGFPLSNAGCNDDFGSLQSGVGLTYAAGTTYSIQVGGYGGATGNVVLNMSLGGDMVVNSTADNNVSDTGLTLREAMLMARGGTGAGGINRALSGPEAFVMINASADGATSDLIHFTPGVFPSGAPASVLLGSALPDLNATKDVVSGIGAGVIVDGQALGYGCFVVSGSLNVIEGIQARRCSTGDIYISGANNTIGGSVIAAQRNVLRESATAGIVITGAGATGNAIIGNYIGTNASGTSMGPGSASGILIDSGAHNNTIGGSGSGQGNLISSNSFGVKISGAGSNANVVVGNMIGTDANGTAPLGNSGGVSIESAAQSNMIGGSGAGQGNLISGNSVGVQFVHAGTSFNTVRGNKIGVDITGNAALPNTFKGMVSDIASQNVIGGSGAGEGNVISGNSGAGIHLAGASYGYTIYGNKIGTNAAGVAAVPNSVWGIVITLGMNNLIGGTSAGQGNVIAFNPTGVEVQNSASTGNSVRGNNIYANTGMGIDNNTGGNLELPPPAVTALAGNTVSGIACPLCTVDVYNDLGAQGRLYLGTTSANGLGLFTLLGASHPLPNLTAIAMDGPGNTSEFSAAFAAPIDSDGDGIPNINDLCPLNPEDFDGFQDGDGCPDPDNDADGICDAGQTALSCTGSDSGKMHFDPAGTIPSPTLDCRNVPEDFDAFKDTDGCPEPDNDNDGHPDVSDACPGTDSLAGADTVLGSAEDVNHNGLLDGGEDIVLDGVLTTDDSVLTFEDYDGILDADGCHDSPGDDRDGDGFTDEAEVLALGTDAAKPCGSTGWPADLADNNNRLNIGDINSFVFPLRANSSYNKFGHPVPDPDDANIARWNLDSSNPANAAIINIGDLNAINPGILAATARPPMFGGKPAFSSNAGNGVGGCPFPP